jgi:hypothetical protein
MAHPTGESKDGALKLDFDRRLMVQFRGCVVTSDAGLLAYRELDDALGLSAVAGETLADARTGKNGHHALVGLLRQSVFGRLAGYEDVNDAERPRRRQGGSGLCSFTKPDGALRDAMARGTCKPLCSFRLVRPVDRYRPWSSSTEGHRA